jgi:hypothetical protein
MKFRRVMQEQNIQHKQKGHGNDLRNEACPAVQVTAAAC